MSEKSTRGPLTLSDIQVPACRFSGGTLSGVIKAEPEDFRVDEIPVSEPSGRGEFLLVRLEKRGLTTDDLVAHVATTLGIQRNDVGFAGLKDKHAVTSQWLSMPASAEDQLEALVCEKVRVLEWGRHHERLRRGASLGNRFDILIRGAEEAELALAQEIARHLTDKGLPNAYGVQRFGHQGSTFEMGLQILAGEESQALARIGRHRRQFMKKLALNAVQSGLFNLWLRRRVEDGLLYDVIAGDLLEHLKMGVPVIAMDVERELERYKSGKIMLTGPMFGIKMRGASREALEREETVLQEAGLGLDAFASFRKVMPGARRFALLKPEGLEVFNDSSGLRVSFSLPPGAYATEVLRTFLGDEEGSAEEWSSGSEPDIS